MQALNESLFTGRFLCSALVIGGGLAFVPFHLPASAVPLGIAGSMLLARRQDPWGVILFFSLLTIQMFILFGICWGLNAFFPLGNLPILLVTLLMIKEGHRFFKNEYGQGLQSRNIFLCAIAWGLAILQVIIVW